MKKSLTIAALVVAFAFGAPMSANAAKGVKCGDSYIAAGKTCHKPPAVHHKGKRCGDSYISKKDVCHK